MLVCLLVFLEPRWNDWEGIVLTAFNRLNKLGVLSISRCNYSLLYKLTQGPAFLAALQVIFFRVSAAIFENTFCLQE